MRYAVNVPNFEEYSDVRTVAALAADAEAAGWDGFFVWDHLAFVKAWRLRIADPWMLLTGVALATERLRLGPMVTPLARRRPWKVARETVTLDRLSGGRLVLGVGLGEPPEDEYGTFGEPTDPVVRAAMLDEGLEVLTRLWSGETVSFQGRHYRVDQVAFQPTPVQRPRIPIWVAGAWP
ncbi:MAG TPA: LLM class flavin-dependent oxidoreductase, partial [Actinomycetota bacterium]|nr:LLM class flavin-dependent oxidoreductase [Actinomycetota bacterium]